MREYLRVATTSFDVFDDCDHVLREIDQTDLAQVIDERADRYHRTRMPLPPWLALPWQGTLRWHTARGAIYLRVQPINLHALLKLILRRLYCRKGGAGYPRTPNDDSHQDGSPEKLGRSIDLLTRPTESYTVTETIGWLFLICRPACSAAS
jgi:hypothetical protein